MSKWLKLILPEYVLYQLVKKYGFIRKRRRRTHNYQNTPPQSSSNSRPSTVPNQASNNQTSSCASGTCSTNRNNNTSSKKSCSNNSCGLNGSSNKSSKSNNASSGGSKKPISINKAALDSKLNNVRTTMRKELLAQNESIDEMIIAFKRPFLTKPGADQPRNSILICGHQGSGRSLLVLKMVQNLYKEGLLSSAGIDLVSMNLYPTTSQKPLFLKDLYKALKSSGEVIVFNNIEQAHRDSTQILIELITTGIYQFTERYEDKNGDLVVTSDGVLKKNAVDILESNGKYFIFMTSSSEKSILEKLGVVFMRGIYDVIIMDEYDLNEILLITTKMLKDFIIYVKETLGFTLTYTTDFKDYCASKYKKNEGFIAIHSFMLDSVYRGISEYKVRHSVADKETSIIINYDKDKDDMTLIENGHTDGEIEVFSMKTLIAKSNRANNGVSIEDVKAELQSVIGLQKVKDFILDLEHNLEIQRHREEKGQKMTSISGHMIFTGNPGTGKTMMARIVSKYLKAIGMLSSGHLREVSRSDLVGQYVGHTAKQTHEVIQSAMGGILFIDEAYALCRDKHDIFGLEAVDALVKAIEDYRDNFIVILAGYTDEMEQFLKNNPGLKSRFPNIIEFEDYSALEMLEIAKNTAESKGYSITPECEEGLVDLFERSQIPGRNDSGNGRMVRNVIEAAILQQSRRITKDTPTDEMSLLLVDDFNFETFEKFDLEQQLSTIIGLEGVKDFMREQQKMLIANQKRQAMGLTVDTTQSLNMIFTGNPGTGKTTIARVVASMFKDMGLLKSGHLVEVDRSGLVAEYVGHTAKKTEAVFRSALGGILFVDEAYALSNNHDSFGKEAIDTLVKLIEDYRGQILVILAGYKREMKDFMKSNSGLQSRFALVIDFPDYTAPELYAIARKMIDAKGLFLANQRADDALKNAMEQAHHTSNEASGNGRMVRNFIEKILRNQSARVASLEHATKEMMISIESSDIQKEDTTKQEAYDLEAQFAPIIGLNQVKDYIRSLAARLSIQQQRKQMGLDVDTRQSLHMIFAGNPGTGKTMMARTIADLLFHMGVLRSDKFIETDRAGLVAGYVGQTALKTTEKVMEAMDGVLFIDEAYALAQGSHHDFGREAIDTLVKLMDDHRDRLVVILAGYSSNMKQFLQVNPGLKSRFPNIIEFSDYEALELMQIAEGLYRSKGYELTQQAKQKLAFILQEASTKEWFGNGRYVRNIYEASINRQSLRLSHLIGLTKQMLITIDHQDIVEV
ncbi:AAA family ATPase (plasmid) [Entomospira entomophila]|nr:AAA family ATPase [Entomospira entomophilus]WDI36204.1 AAA family ATPase [Entomospira entomophilus]